jgi:hypothetical protein
MPASQQLVEAAKENQVVVAVRPFCVSEPRTPPASTVGTRTPTHTP